MSVSLLRTVRLRVNAGSAKPGPAIGQALGPLGLNMAEFCKQFNDRTKGLDSATPVPVVLSGKLISFLYCYYFSMSSHAYLFSSSYFDAAFSNRTFTFVTRTPPTTWFLKKCTGLKKGAAR
jgi:large subunit ribosomal protein L11